jgi:hypothetical protein
VNHVRSNYSIHYLGTDPSPASAGLFIERGRIGARPMRSASRCSLFGPAAFGHHQIRKAARREWSLRSEI